MHYTTCWGLIEGNLFERLKAIKLVSLDVDGTLTDSGIYYDNSGLELKKFGTKDGLGIAQLQRSGVKCVIITGRKSALVERRAAELKISRTLQGVEDKKQALQALMAEFAVTPEQTMAVGDDCNDLPQFEAAGFCACPADAHPYIRRTADLVLTQDGGRGAVREICDLIMMAQHKMSLDGRML